MNARTFVVHGLPAMTLAELAAINCGHCHHRLSWHVTQDKGSTHCSACHCLRSPAEDIRQPHDFTGGVA